jgi:Virulence factor BrkB
MAAGLCARRTSFIRARRPNDRLRCGFFCGAGGLSGVVASYSLFAGPNLGEVLLRALRRVLPKYALQVISRQIRHASAYGTAEAKRLGITSVLGFATLIVSTNMGTTALFRGLNAVYGQEEQRGLLAFIATSLAFTVGAIVFLVFSIGAVVLLPRLLGLEAVRRKSSICCAGRLSSSSSVSLWPSCIGSGHAEVPAGRPRLARSVRASAGGPVVGRVTVLECRAQRV